MAKVLEFHEDSGTVTDLQTWMESLEAFVNHLKGTHCLGPVCWEPREVGASRSGALTQSKQGTSGEGGRGAPELAEVGWNVPKGDFEGLGG